MANPVIQWQILTAQPQKLEDFYCGLFDWKVSTDNPLGFRQIDTNSKEGINGGIWDVSKESGHSMVQLFIRVDDVDEHLRKAEELGAHVIIPPQTLPDGDRMTVMLDPDGIPFAMYQNVQMQAK